MTLSKTYIPVFSSVFFLSLSIFTKELGHYNLFGIDYDLIGYSFFLIYFFDKLLKNKLHLSFSIIFLFAIILISNIFLIITNNNELSSFLKQFIPIVIIYLVCYDIILRNNINHVFRVYVEMAFYSSIIGLIQFVLKILGIKFLSLTSQIRIDSVAYEPSHYVAILIPAVIYSIVNFKIYKEKCIVMTLALILTLSLTGYVILGAILLLAFNKIYYLIYLLPLGYYIYSYFIITNPDYNFRINDILEYFKTGDYYYSHGTPFSFSSNMHVAIESINKNPVLGCGLGQHENMYYQTLKPTDFYYSYQYGLNANSGHSLTIRIFSETGILGFIFYIYMLIRNFFLKLTYEEKIISLACLSHFMSKTLKLGGYFDYGTPFFFMILVIIYFRHNQLRKLNKLKHE